MPRPASTSGVRLLDAHANTRAKPIARSDIRSTSHRPGSIGSETVVAGRLEGSIEEQRAENQRPAPYSTPDQYGFQLPEAVEHFRSQIPADALDVVRLFETVPTPFRKADLMRELSWSAYRVGYWCDKLSGRYGALVASRYGFVWAWEVQESA